MDREAHRTGMLFTKIDNKLSENSKSANVCLTEINEKAEAKQRAI